MPNSTVNPIFIRNREKVLALLNHPPRALKSSRKILPDFMVIGAPKAGTSALHQYLRQHPDIYIPPIKNPSFFIYEGQEASFWGRNVINNLDAYHALFQCKKNEKAIGEVSPGYLPDHSSPARIHFHIPNVKMIVMLRNPIERAFSQFCFNHQIGVERFTDFREALTVEMKIMQGVPTYGNPKYIRTGFYHQQLDRYYRFFPANQMLLLLYEDFVKSPNEELRKIFTFINVDPNFTPDISVRHNVTNVPKSRTLDQLSKSILSYSKKNFFFSKAMINIGTSLEKINSGKLPPVPEHIKDFLRPIYREDILMLQERLQRDLGHWMK